MLPPHCLHPAFLQPRVPGAGLPHAPQPKCSAPLLPGPPLSPLTAGAIFFADMLVTFHVGFIATYNTRE